MRVSIITASFNSEKTILDCVESVNNQTYPNIEHIFIDGGSTDATVSLIKSRSLRKSVVLSEADQGIYDAFNKGISSASGDVILFLNSDDTYTDIDVIHDVVGHFKSNPELDAIYGNLQYMSLRAPHRVVRTWANDVFAVEKLKFGWMPPHPTFCAKREVYSEFGVYDLSYKIAADYELMLRFILSGITLGHLDRFMVDMKMGGVSNASVKNVLKKTTEDASILNRHDLPVLAGLFGKNLRKLGQYFK